MGKKLRLGIVLLAVMVATVIALAQNSSEPSVQMTEVYQFADGSEVDDSFARLTRYDNGVTTAISTSDLVEGEVYTLWWVIFNHPENCSEGICNGDDIFALEDGELVRDDIGNFVLNLEGIERAGISIQHAAGGYAADDTFNTSASLGMGDVPGIVIGPGLLDPAGAEVHLVVRTHGEKVEAVYADQISTFGGGCDPIMGPPCQDVQFAVFSPMS